MRIIPSNGEPPHALDDRPRAGTRSRVMQQLDSVRRIMQQPLMIVLGVLTGAGAAKLGHGTWVAGGLLTLVPAYVGAVVTVMATRSLAAWVVRMRRTEVLAQAARQAPR